MSTSHFSLHQTRVNKRDVNKARDDRRNAGLQTLSKGFVSLYILMRSHTALQTEGT